MTDELPPLPPCDIEYTVTDSTMRVMDCYAHSDDQMQDYARAAIAAHEAKQTAEPVAWARYPRFTGSLQRQEVVFNRPTDGDWTPLYTNPQPAKREPLTDEQWLAYLLKHGGVDVIHVAAFTGQTIQSQGKWCLTEVANNLRKLVEAAHGIFAEPAQDITKDTPWS
jgi:hypothetical protein